MKGSYNTSFTSNKRKEIRKIANRRVFPTSDTDNNDSNEKIFKFFARIRYEKSNCHPDISLEYCSILCPKVS